MRAGPLSKVPALQQGRVDKRKTGADSSALRQGEGFDA
jgi:hypothetical protein